MDMKKRKIWNNKGYENHCVTIVHNPRGVQGTNFSYTSEYAFFIFPKGTKSIKNRKKNLKKNLRKIFLKS